MKGKVRVTINRETVRELLQTLVQTTMMHDFELKEFTIHHKGDIELVIEQTPRESALLLVALPAGDPRPAHGMGAVEREPDDAAYERPSLKDA